MRRALLASYVLIVATVVGIAATRAISSQASGPPGTWSKVASLMTGRAKHTATLLRNGSVLVAGGVDRANNGLASAEVYNPATNKWSPAGSMVAARLEHTATLLPSGKVLVAGGVIMPYPSRSLATTELYDPTTNSWSAAASMIGSRTRHTATLLSDGRVLVVGGQSFPLREGGFVVSQPPSAEIYDPQSNRWATTGPMGFYRVGQTASRLADGRVLVAGGRGDRGSLTSTEIYNAAADRWISAAPMGVARSGHVATLLQNGDVFVAAGIGEDSNSLPITLTSGEIYDPRTNLWATVASIADTDVGNTATLLRKGMVLVVGRGPWQPELYDPARNAWSRTGPSMGGHVDTSTLLPDGRVLLVGGYGNESLGSVLVFDPNGVAPVSRQPLDLRVIAAVALVALLIVAGFAWSSPAVRRRVKGWGPHDQPEKWIT
jgi:N-acetylneuraminic acid mutarotase